jgi:FkbM family methyltransferase
MVRKFVQYISEALFCLKVGVNLRTKMGLLRSVFQLHLGNFHGGRIDDRDLQAVPYQILTTGGSREIWMRPGSGDIFIFLEVFFLKDYEFTDSKKLSIKQIVDLGANIGLTSLFFLQHWPESRCLCVEPNPANLAILKKNTSSLGSQMEILDGAIDSTSGIKSLSSEGWSYGGKLGGGGDLKVECFTMDDVLSRYHITDVDLLKIDIEGAEAQLFGSNLAWLNQVKYLIIELHGGISKIDILNVLKPFGFRDLRSDDTTADFVMAENTQKL